MTLRKGQAPAFIFLYHPDRDSREFAALAGKEEHEQILRLRKENPFVVNLHPIRAEEERSVWAVYFMDPRRPATHSSDVWDCGEEAKTPDCNIRMELSLPTEATVSTVCKALKYCFSTRAVRDARISKPDCQGRTAKEILESLNVADDSLDRLKEENPYIANVKLADRYDTFSQWDIYVRDARWPADKCSEQYERQTNRDDEVFGRKRDRRRKRMASDCNGRIRISLPPMETMRGVCARLGRRCSPYSILEISSAPVYDLTLLAEENDASEDNDLTRIIRASRQIRELFSEIQLIRQLRVTSKTKHELVVTHLLNNLTFDDF